MSAADPSEEAPRTVPPPRRAGRLVLAALLVALGFDLTRAGPQQLSGAALVGAIDAYRATLSPLMPAMGVSCRFTPTCSFYGREVIRRDGAVVGSLRTVGRIARCGPWTPMGTVDPP